MASGESDSTRLDAPRILKAPPRWKFSHLKRSCLPAMAEAPCELKIGVRCARGRMRWAASRTSSGLTEGLSGCFKFKILAHPAQTVLVLVMQCRDAGPVVAADEEGQE